jgi:hypothetical protein
MPMKLRYVDILFFQFLYSFGRAPRLSIHSLSGPTMNEMSQSDYKNVSK